ncbi:hypothetical protein JCM30471_28380 [Desulfuromonas carbonis]|uniref:hypothetical protein n=1 Tax=Desulfuromonas sp. DDH964 TaxID=1823759 RepID=UPI00078B9204|nr:hypothetical protein [Desulfuromonas sp. DDH964]AMV71019.1 hypothetical protein DBW_0628 [Desulfuromonas sp. DDH964]
MPRFPLMLLLLALATACAPVQVPVPGDDCLALLRAVDQAVVASGCRNAAYFPIPEAPYLRTSRFWASFGQRDLTATEFRSYAAELRRLDREARTAELSCLAQQATPTSAGENAATSLVPGSEACAEQLLTEALIAPDTLRATLRTTRVPDDYRTWRRVVGLYPLVSLPVAMAVANAYDDRRDWYRQELQQWLEKGTWQTGAPAAGPPAPAAEVARRLAGASANPLKVPLPDREDAWWLAANFAPLFIQQQENNRDRWGRVERSATGFTIDPERPLVYWYWDHLFRGTEPLLRLNYVTWYPERSGGDTPWIERGAYDGLTVGITLAADGRPLLVQTMNNCGCYHQFFPGGQLPPPRPLPFAPDPLVPQQLPETGPGERLAVYITTGWHQVIRLAAHPAPPAATGYGLADYSDLEQLPGPEGGRPSLFNSAGILPGSERIERGLFFSLGIPSVGSMRQRGHQPITLLGREHYDDPQLLDRTFGGE